MPQSIAALLTSTRDAGASDLHLSSGMPPIIRQRGEIVRANLPPMSAEETRAMVYEIMSADQRAYFEAHHEIDFGFEIPEVARFRANIFMQRRGPGAVFRVIPARIRTLEDLGCPPVLREMAMKDRGLVLVTGPTGSGKSTTLAAMIDFLNAAKQGHIITIEDPIEFVHESKKCLINQREVGAHTKDFATALRSALREDPDCLLVGELRDLETTSLAITAAETGHLVFGTLHTNSAAKTIDRLIDVFPGDRQSQVRTMLSESLEGVIAQTLIPTADGKARVAALEILVGIPALRNLIREDKTAQILSIMQVGTQHGMQTLDQALKDLVTTGKITREEALKRTTNPRLFEGAGSGPAAGAGAPSGSAAGTRAAVGIRP
ncbi:MAG TPA: type IV pilus twitching motility protein PilT [Candidatus Eisenbacteria bacterium]